MRGWTGAATVECVACCEGFGCGRVDLRGMAAVGSRWSPLYVMGSLQLIGAVILQKRPVQIFISSRCGSIDLVPNSSPTLSKLFEKCKDVGSGVMIVHLMVVEGCCSE